MFVRNLLRCQARLRSALLCLSLPTRQKHNVVLGRCFGNRTQHYHGRPSLKREFLSKLQAVTKFANNSMSYENTSIINRINEQIERRLGPQHDRPASSDESPLEASAEPSIQDIAYYVMNTWLQNARVDMVKRQQLEDLHNRAIKILDLREESIEEIVLLSAIFSLYGLHDYGAILSRAIVRGNHEIGRTMLRNILSAMVISRNHYGLLYGKELEPHLINYLKDADIEDASLVSLAFFKTMTRIANPLIANQIMLIAENELPKVNFLEPTLSSIIKSIRYSRLNEKIIASTERFTRAIFEFSNDEKFWMNRMFLMQLLKFMVSYRIYDSKFVDKLLTKMSLELSDPQGWRIKDIQYILTSVSIMNIKINELNEVVREGLDKLCKQIVREDREDREYVRLHVMPLLRSFAMIGYYNADFVKFVNTSLSREDEHALKTVGKGDPVRSLVMMYAALKIEGREEVLDCNKIVRAFADSIVRDRSMPDVVKTRSSQKDFAVDFYDNQLVIKNSMMRMRNMLEKNLPKDNVFVSLQRTMAHQNYDDLIVSKGAPAPGDFDPHSLLPKKTTKGSHCMILALRNWDYSNRGSRLTGTKRYLIDLFDRLGYKTVTLNIDNYDEVNKLDKKVREALDLPKR